MCCQGTFEFREVDQVRVVGRDTPVTIYEPLGKAGMLDLGTQRLISTYSEALKLYRDRRFRDAAELFETRFWLVMWIRNFCVQK